MRQSNRSPLVTVLVAWFAASWFGWIFLLPLVHATHSSDPWPGMLRAVALVLGVALVFLLFANGDKGWAALVLVLCVLPGIIGSPLSGRSPLSLVHLPTTPFSRIEQALRGPRVPPAGSAQQSPEAVSTSLTRFYSDVLLIQTSHVRARSSTAQLCTFLTSSARLQVERAFLGAPQRHLPSACSAAIRRAATEGAFGHSSTPAAMAASVAFTGARTATYDADNGVQFELTASNRPGLDAWLIARFVGGRFSRG